MRNFGRVFRLQTLFNYFGQQFEFGKHKSGGYIIVREPIPCPVQLVIEDLNRIGGHRGIEHSKRKLQTGFYRLDAHRIGLIPRARPRGRTASGFG